jgi:hypothetical protein
MKALVLCLLAVGGCATMSGVQRADERLELRIASMNWHINRVELVCGATRIGTVRGIELGARQTVRRHVGDGCLSMRFRFRGLGEDFTYPISLPMRAGQAVCIDIRPAVRQTSVTPCE